MVHIWSYYFNTPQDCRCLRRFSSPFLPAVDDHFSHVSLLAAASKSKQPVLDKPIYPTPLPNTVIPNLLSKLTFTFVVVAPNSTVVLLNDVNAPTYVNKGGFISVL